MVLSLPACADPPPVEAFARLPLVTDADLSPSGRYVVTTANIDGRPRVAVLDLDTGQWQSAMAGESAGYRVRWCRWKSDARLICGLRGTFMAGALTAGSSRMIALDRDGRDQKVLVLRENDPFQSESQAAVISMLRDDPDDVLVNYDDDLDGRPSVFRVNVFNGRMHRHTEQFAKVRHFYADPSGAVRAAFGQKDLDLSLWVRDTGDGPWRLLDRYRAFATESTEFLGFSSDPQHIYVRTDDRGRDAVWELDLSDRAPPRLVFGHPEVDVGSPVVWQDRMVGVRYESERPEIHFLDPDARALFGLMKAALPGTFPEVVGESRDGRRLLVAAHADRQPPLYVLFDRGTMKAQVIARTYPDLVPERLASMRAISYPARDGVRVPGYLTVPPGAPATRLPLVVMPHGGPIARDTWRFDFLQQFLVSRGYAVLQMDFRGSAGYGDAWYGAAHQDWGGLTYDDVIDGVRWAVDRKIADPQRIAIVGWSFGGYVSLLGAVRNGDLFRCAVSIAGVSDLQVLENFTSRTNMKEISREQIGRDRAKLEANSPRSLAANATIPVLLFHGTDDVQAPVIQSRAMSAALKKAGKPHEYIEFADETHQIDHEKNRIAMLRRIEAFLRENLGTAAEH